MIGPRNRLILHGDTGVGTACPHWVSESFLSKRGRAVPRPCSRALNQACVSILLILRAAMIIMDAMTTTPESALMYRL